MSNDDLLLCGLIVATALFVLILIGVIGRLAATTDPYDDGEY